MNGGPKLATFTVAASVEQGAAWKRAAELAGHLSIGTWLAEAADVHARLRPRAAPTVPASLVAPSPISLTWRRGGRFRVVLEDGEEVEREGVLVSPPFGIFRGHELGREYTGIRSYTLVFLPERRILGTFRFVGKARALAAELAPTLLRGGPSPGSAGEART